MKKLFNTILFLILIFAISNELTSQVKVKGYYALTDTIKHQSDKPDEYLNNIEAIKQLLQIICRDYLINVKMKILEYRSKLSEYKYRNVVDDIQQLIEWQTKVQQAIEEYLYYINSSQPKRGGHD